MKSRWLVLFCLTCLSHGLVLASEVMRVSARSGDRCVTLHWHTAPEVPSHVFRAEQPRGSFVEVPGSPVAGRSFADLQVENGRTYYYRVMKNAREEVAAISGTPRPFLTDDDFLDFLQGTAFDYFWYEVNPENGLVRDRNTARSFSSIAAIGFGLTGIGIGVDRGWVTRGEGAERTRRTLRTLWNAPQGPGERTAGYKGWFYHFLEMDTALRFRRVELSSIDTALMLAGVLYAKEFFNTENEVEREIRSLAQKLYDRVDWAWMLNGEDTLTMGWHPETGFIKARWKGYNEASILYLLGLGAEGRSRLEPKHWEEWTRTYSWSTSYGFSFIHFAPLFGHQYSACWIDFRGIADDYMRSKGITYFENSRRATLAQRAYAVENPKGHRGYGPNVWGLTASDGPRGYAARGTPPPENDDGTIAPTAAGGSLPFAPNECIVALRHMYDAYRENIVCGYGFRDAFNLSVKWWDPDVIGIDQGPILIMAENLRTGRVWQLMQKSEPLQRGLRQSGFRRMETMGGD